jgi:hypothetical protein
VSVANRADEVPGSPRVAAPRRPSRRRWVPLLVLVAAPLLYAAVWRLAKRIRPQTASAVLLVSRLEGGEWVDVTDGVEIPARARVRFAVRLDRPAAVVLLGLNAALGATLYVPASGSPPRVEAGTSVLGERVLDGLPGPELFLAVLCNTPVPAATVVKAGERAAAAAGEPDRVQTLDLGCPEAHLRVRKEAPR